MKNRAAILVLCLLVGLALAACGTSPSEDEGPSQAERDATATQAAIDRSATQTAAAPTHTPKPTPTRTPTPTPTPVPLTAQDILEQALAAMAEADSYHFVMDLQMKVEAEGLSMEVPMLFEGDFQAPDRMQGSMEISVLGLSVEVAMVIVGDTTYVSDPETGEWEVSTEPVAPFSPDEFTAVDPADIEGLEIVGEETLDGRPVHHLRGTVSTERLGDQFADTSGELEAEYWIGVEDRLLYESLIAGEIVPIEEGGETPLGGAGTIQMEAMIQYSDYGKPVTIEPPEFPTPTPAATFAPAVATAVPPVPDAMRALGPGWISYANANAANDLAVGEEGALWVATDSGALRWNLRDGTFRRYTVTDGLADNAVTAIAVAGDGSIWFGTEAGLSRLDGDPASGIPETWTTYTVEDGLASDWVQALAVDPPLPALYESRVAEAGVLWVGTASGVSRYDGDPASGAFGTWTSYTTADGLVDDDVISIAVDADGGVWFGTLLGGASYFDGETWTSYTTEDDLVGDWVQDIAVDAQGAVWFATTDGVSRFRRPAPSASGDAGDGDTWTTYTSDDGLPANDIQALAIAPDETIWFGAYAGGVASLEGDTWTLYSSDDGLGGDDVSAIVVAGDDTVWFATASGVSGYDGETWNPLRTDDCLSGNEVTSIAVAADGTLWFGTDSGVSRFDGGAWTIYTTADGLASNEVESLAAGPDGSIWAGTFAAGVSHLPRPVPSASGVAGDGESWTSYSTADGLAGDWVQDIVVGPPRPALRPGGVAGDGAIWFGTTDGVSRWDGETWATYTAADGLAASDVQAIAVAPDGALWFGTYLAGVSRFDGETWTTYTTEDGLAGDNVQAVAVTADGVVWCGTADGVSRFDGDPASGAGGFWTTYTTEDGLADDDTLSIAVAADGTLWFGSAYGVSRFDGTTWQIFGEEEIPGAWVAAIAIGPDGALWFGTNQGVTRYLPEE